MLRSFFDFEQQKKQLKVFEAKMGTPTFWDSSDKDLVISSVKKLKLSLDPWKDIFAKFNEVEEFYFFLKDEGESNDSINAELSGELSLLEKKLNQEELKLFLSNEEDFFDVFLSINAGAGGRESCDWARMLLRMYERWSERQSFETKVIDILQGEDNGIKNIVLSIKGNYAYGYLKAEKGVHRLVRISPFDSNKRRHTSFASVDVTPQLDKNVNILINEADLRIDTYRSGGAGGQHVNKTDSAVRITHLPTGLVVQCQNERSQYKNKSSAMKMIKSKLFEKELSERRLKEEVSYSQKQEIAWGSQIRSYIYQPYTLVKDHRIDYQTGNILNFMDGHLDPFIEVYLKSRMNKKPHKPLN